MNMLEVNSIQFEEKFVSHPLIKSNIVERRLYQEILAARVVENGNSLVVAPTALGKTIIAVLVAAFILEKNPESKLVFLSPTKPLAQQHEQSLKKILNLGEEKIALLTGTVMTQERKELWEKSMVISATPQTIENSILRGEIDFEKVSLLVFDESHRAVGDYSYVYLARRYMKQAKNPLILALTASPGSQEERIQEVCKNLFIKNIEIKTVKDFDVKEYVNEIEVDWKFISLPSEFIEIKNLLDSFIKEQIQFFRKIGYSRHLDFSYIRRNELLALQALLRKDMIEKGRENPSLYVAVSKIASLLKILHARTLLETQGLNALNEYFKRLKLDASQINSSKAVKSIIKNEEIYEAIQKTEKLIQQNILHPKLIELKQILLQQFKSNPESKVLVFNHYRDSISGLIEFLNQFPEIKAQKFIGQASKDSGKGMSQKEQLEVIQDLKKGIFNVLCCSSVAEEGLDIPSVDLVIFFEPVPSEIRLIQRMGRTGRIAKGKVIILIAKNTSDEGIYWASIAKEKKMHSTLKEMKKNSSNYQTTISNANALPKQSTLIHFHENQKVLIYVDTREQNSSLIGLLEEKDAIIKVKQIEVGDYVLSDQIVVERKTLEDFLNSIIDGRLFNQLNKMNENYDSPLILVEGNQEELFSLRNIHRNAIIGALTSIALNYRIPILFTKNSAETAEYLFLTAKREQLGKGSDIRLRVGRKGLTLSEQQRFLVEGLPMVGPQMARSLLNHFGSIKAIANADQKELQEIENLGEKKARAIKNVLQKKFSEEENNKI